MSELLVASSLEGTSAEVGLKRSGVEMLVGTPACAVFKACALPIAQAELLSRLEAVEAGQCVPADLWWVPL